MHIKAKIMMGDQAGAQSFADVKKVTEIRPGEVPARITGAVPIQGRFVRTETAALNDNLAL